jgi:methylglutaconyl-CoA hydratase
VAEAVTGGLRVEHDGLLLRVTLARPERHNAFDAELIAALTEAFASAGEARAVVLAGEGASFSAGADLEWMRSSIDLTPDENIADAGRLRAMLDAVDGCPAPVVAGVRGHAIAAACGVLACCDVVVASPESSFSFSEVKLGLVPAVISPFVLARIGAGAARRLFLTGERFDAQTALRIGLVHELAGDLTAGLDRVVADLLNAGPEAVRAAKQIARGHLRPEETARAIAERRTSEEGQEGLRAFLERRPPAWRSPR